MLGAALLLRRPVSACLNRSWRETLGFFLLICGQSEKTPHFTPHLIGTPVTLIGGRDPRNCR